MFEILKQKDGVRGSFIRLIKLGEEDFTVLVRSSDDGRIQHRYVGPDYGKADEVFDIESRKIIQMID